MGETVFTSFKCLSHPLRLGPVPQNWSRKPRNVPPQPAQTRSPKAPAAKPTVTTESLTTGPGLDSGCPEGRVTVGSAASLSGAVRFAEYPHEHGPDGPVLLAVDQEFGEGASSRSGRRGVP
jgi:hypothetical protein